MIADLGYFNLSIPVLLKPLTGCPARTVHRRDVVRAERNSDPSSDWCLVTAADMTPRWPGEAADSRSRLPHSNQIQEIMSWGTLLAFSRSGILIKLLSDLTVLHRDYNLSLSCVSVQDIS